MVNPWALVQDQDGRMVRWEMMEMIRGKVGQGGEGRNSRSVGIVYLR